MRIQDQTWEPVRNGQIIHRITPSTIGFVAKIYRLDNDTLTDDDWERIKLIAAAPALLKALEPFAQVIERFESQSAYNSEASDLLSVSNILNRYGKINLGHLRQAHAAIARLRNKEA